MPEILEILRPLVIVIALILFEAVPDILSNELHWPSLLTKVGTGIVIVILICVLDVVYRRWTEFTFVRRSRQIGRAHV